MSTWWLVGLRMTITHWQQHKQETASDVVQVIGGIVNLIPRFFWFTHGMIALLISELECMRATWMKKKIQTFSLLFCGHIRLPSFRELSCSLVIREICFLAQTPVALPEWIKWAKQRMGRWGHFCVVNPCESRQLSTPLFQDSTNKIDSKNVVSQKCFLSLQLSSRIHSHSNSLKKPIVFMFVCENGGQLRNSKQPESAAINPATNKRTKSRHIAFMWPAYLRNFCRVPVCGIALIIMRNAAYCPCTLHVLMSWHAHYGCTPQ